MVLAFDANAVADAAEKAMTSPMRNPDERTVAVVPPPVRWWRLTGRRMLERIAEHRRRDTARPVNLVEDEPLADLG